TRLAPALARYGRMRYDARHEHQPNTTTALLTAPAAAEDARGQGPHRPVDRRPDAAPPPLRRAVRRGRGNKGGWDKQALLARPTHLLHSERRGFSETLLG